MSEPINQNQQNPETTPATNNQPPTKPVEQVGLRVSLIPAEEADRKDPKKGFKNFLLIAGVILFFFASIVSILGIKVYLNIKKVAVIDLEIKDIERQSNELTASIKDAKAVQIRLRNLNTLLENHKTGLKILTFLEKHTLPDVSYTAFSSGANGTVNLGVTASSFESYAAQINEYKNLPEVKTFSASSVTPVYGENNSLVQVNFSLSLTVDESIFLTKSSLKATK
jgi:hypothetical protein